jgi:hypothetical protein
VLFRSVYFGTSATSTWRQRLSNFDPFSGNSILTISESTNGGSFTDYVEISAGGGLTVRNGGISTLTGSLSSSLGLNVGGSNVISNTRLGAFAVGTAAAPSYSFSGDSNTGVYRPGIDIIGFSTAGSEKMRISAAGNVSIGNTNNTFKLDVSGTGRFTDNLNVTTESRYFQAAGPFAWGNSTTIGARMGTDGVAGLIDFRRWLGGGTLHQVAAVRQVVGGSSRYGLGFLANDISTNSVASTVRMYIDPNNGNVGIGTTSPTYKLEVTGDVKFNTGALGVNVNPNATDGRIDASNDIVAFSSDRRLKTNVQLIENPIGKIRNLSGFTYNWNKKANELAKYDTKQSFVGVYAQEVQAVLPEAVKLAPFDNDGNDKSISGENYLTVQYEKIVPLLIEAIKEQQKQIDELKMKIDGITN